MKNWDKGTIPNLPNETYKVSGKAGMETQMP